MDTTTEVVRSPLSVRLEEHEWQRLDELQKDLGLDTRTNVIKWLLKYTRIRRPSVVLVQRGKEEVAA